MNITEQLNRGYLICPKTKATLFSRGEELESELGSRYPFLNGVPMLIDKTAQQKYLSENAAAMVAEYESESAAPSPRKGIRSVLWQGLKLDAFWEWLDLDEDYRSEESIAAFKTVIKNQSEEALLLAVGGGPQRKDPKLTNLNIAPFQNVDLVADAYSLPYKDSVVDAVYCEAVLEHLEFPDQAVAEMARVLKPGGQIIAITPFLQPYHGYPNHFQNFTLIGHERLIARHNLEIVASGVSVGPSFVLSQLGNAYLTKFSRKLMPSTIGTILFGLLRKRDLRVNYIPNAVDFASTTFVHAKKPLAQDK